MPRVQCQGCGKPVTGTYTKALGAAWHAECFCCTHCGKLISSSGFVEKNGKPYHPACYHERYSPRCHACKQPLEGEYLRALGKLWHPEHFVCTHCGKTIVGDYFVHRRKPYCNNDFRLLFLDKCALCAAPLETRFLIDIWGNKYCHKHEKEPRCLSCDRLIGMKETGSGIRYSDGRIICQSCSPHTITEVSDAYHCMQKVQQVLAQYDFQFERKLRIPLQLVGQDEIQATLSKRIRSRNTAGLTHTNIETLFGVESMREVKGIKVLFGLPPEHLGSVLAHELGHVWLFLNRYPHLSEKLEEGICELMASYWLQSQESELAKVRLKLLEKNNHRIYGTGFRTVRKAVESASLAYVLDYVRRHASLP